MLGLAGRCGERVVVPPALCGLGERMTGSLREAVRVAFVLAVLGAVAVFARFFGLGRGDCDVFSFSSSSVVVEIWSLEILLVRR